MRTWCPIVAPILIPTRDGEQGRFNLRCEQGATYGMTQLLYSDAIVGYLSEFAKTTDHRPEILLSFGFVPKLETKIGLINWPIQDPGNPAVAAEQEFVSQLAAIDLAESAGSCSISTSEGDRRVAELGFPLSIHFEAAYESLQACVRDLAEMLEYWAPDRVG